MDIKQTADETARKARGAFFTPEPIAKFLTEWAVRTQDDVVLEPSCGEAAFLLTAATRLSALGASVTNIAEQLHGFDIHPESVESAKAFIRPYAGEARLKEGDFFQQPPRAEYDAVIGNPPYVRYQAFSGEPRTRALEAAFRQGVRLTQLSSSWAAFTVHASAFLKPGGRLALVLPAELLTVKYAAQVRRFLLQRFSSVRLVLFENLVFPGVLAEVVLLLAEGTGGAKSFEVFQAKNLDDLKLALPSWTGFTPSGDEKWTRALLHPHATDTYQRLRTESSFVPLKNWGETYLGAVTGNNKYFTLTHDDVVKMGLSSAEVLRISPPGSRHLRGLTFSESGWKTLAESGQRCYLFAPSGEPSRAALRYIQSGERMKVHKAYKCMVRDPWWRVPLVDRPDLFFAYMNHDRPRLVRNGANSQLLNSLYGIRLHAKARDLGSELLPLASLNSLTLLGAELVGRSYGGGILKHEPREADMLPMPSQEALSKLARKLRLVSPQVAALLRRNDISPAVAIVDGVILRDHFGLTEHEMKSIRDSRDVLLQRRISRGRTPNGKN